MSYTEKLKNIIDYCKENKLDPNEIMTYSEFNKLDITESILNDAYSKINIVSSKLNFLLNDIKDFYELEVRTCKKINRIHDKIKNIKNDIYFKVNSDFIGFRIKCAIHDIYKIINKLETNFNFFFERNKIIIGNKFTDIITYCYAYDYNTKYIIELQIGHPFGMYVFARDSYIRDNPNSNCIDLWNNNFYVNVRKKILENTDYNIYDNLQKIYGDCEIEQDLLNVLP